MEFQYKMNNRIRRLRQEKNISEDTLSLYLGVSSKTLSSWERGGDFKVSELIQLSNFFEVSPMFLLGYTNKRNDYVDIDSNKIKNTLSKIKI